MTTNNSLLPEAVRNRIEKDADLYANNYPFDYEVEKGYLSGGVAEATRSLLLVEALDKIANNTATPYSEEQAYSWIETARYLASEALTTYNSLP